MKQAQEEILKSLQETIDRTRKALAAMDRGAGLQKYREIHKRLKRAQRSLARWKKVAAKLEQKKKARTGEEPKKEEPAKAGPAPKEAAMGKGEPAKKEAASGEKADREPAPTS